ncbi:hypothetical protein SUGI_0251100 [Cryptomeria japonica]|nr:hypothetical protein SUGI_0251100 [Cryptomeria japonica]
MLGIIHIYRSPLWVDWIVDDSEALDLVTSSGISIELGTGSHMGIVEIIIGQSDQEDMIPSSCLTWVMDDTHVGNVDAVEIPVLMCESFSVVASTEWNSHDHSDNPLVQEGVFHLDCVLRCAYQFTFSPHTQVLTITDGSER